MSAQPADDIAPGAAPRWRAEVLAGATVALVMVALDGAYGVVAFAALGPGALPAAFMAGLAAAVIANLVTAAAGGRGPLIGGPVAALALLAHPLVAGLAADPRLRGADGAPQVGPIVAIVAGGVVLAGALQLALGLLRAGRLARYVPYPVHAGFMNGVAVLMFLVMIPHFAGVRGVPTWDTVRPLSVAIAAGSFVIALTASRWTKRVPAVLLALAAGTAAHHLGAAWLGSGHVGQLLGRLPLEAPGVGTLQQVAGFVADGVWTAHWRALLAFALATALLSTLQTLLAGSAVDTRVRQRHDSDREVVGQGLANVVCGAAGGLAVAGSAARSLIGLDAGGRGTGLRVWYALGLLALLLLASPWLPYLSMSALAGVFAASGVGLVDAWSRSATRRIAAGLLRGQAVGGELLRSYAAMLVVAAVSVFASVGEGVLVGLVIGMVMFIVRNARNPVRVVRDAAQRSSRKIRTAEQSRALRERGAAIVLVELGGPLFFGTADAAAREIERHVRDAEQVVIDFARVTDVDVSGARVLLQAATELHRARKRLLVAALDRPGGPLPTIREVDVHQVLESVERFDDVDLALEAAEDTLLARVAPAAATPRLALRETMLGGGLDASGLAALQERLEERRYAPGELLFRQGEAGDALFVAVQGRIAIWARGAGGAPDRRMVSFAPGVVFGEMAMLSGAPRSADGVAEDDAVVLVLSRAGFDELGQVHPAAAAQLLRNVALHLAARLRALTDELQETRARP